MRKAKCCDFGEFTEKFSIMSMTAADISSRILAAQATGLLNAIKHVANFLTLPFTVASSS